MTRILPPAAEMSEAELQREIVDLMVAGGWHIRTSDRKSIEEQADALGVEAFPDGLPGLVFHPRVMYRSEPGWPDLTGIRRRDRRLLFAELKKESGKETQRQRQVLDLLRCLETEPVVVVGRPGEARAVSAIVSAIRDQQRSPRIEVHVWRPSDLESGAIAEILR